jgi:hypothetical protein
MNNFEINNCPFCRVKLESAIESYGKNHFCNQCLRLTPLGQKMSHYQITVYEIGIKIKSVLIYPYLIETASNLTGISTHLYKFVTTNFGGRRFIGKFQELPITNEEEMIKRIEHLIAFI